MQTFFAPIRNRKGAGSRIAARAGLGFFCLLLASLASTAQAAGWSGTLVDGGRVTVDPQTNRATVHKGGMEAPLWDGIHRLDDGSYIEIRAGQALPNKQILRARRMPDMPEAETIGAVISGYSPCEKLVRRVCGVGQSCAGDASCNPARQLLDMEKQERAASPNPALMTYTSRQCLQAETDQVLFSTCAREAPPAEITRAPKHQAASLQGPRPAPNCQMLVDKTCGEQNACAGDTGCDLAKQLLNMAREEAVAATNPDIPATSRSDFQCRDALLDNQFFPRCRR